VTHTIRKTNNLKTKGFHASDENGLQNKGVRLATKQNKFPKNNTNQP